MCDSQTAMVVFPWSEGRSSVHVASSQTNLDIKKTEDLPATQQSSSVFAVPFRTVSLLMKSKMPLWTNCQKQHSLCVVILKAFLLSYRALIWLVELSLGGGGKRDQRPRRRKAVCCHCWTGSTSLKLLGWGAARVQGWWGQPLFTSHHKSPNMPPSEIDTAVSRNSAGHKSLTSHYLYSPWLKILISCIYRDVQGNVKLKLEIHRHPNIWSTGLLNQWLLFIWFKYQSSGQ